MLPIDLLNMIHDREFDKCEYNIDRVLLNYVVIV